MRLKKYPENKMMYDSNEALKMALNEGKVWSAYNYYKLLCYRGRIPPAPIDQQHQIQHVKMPQYCRIYKSTVG